MDNSELAKGILGGDRRALARGITLVESTRKDHRQQAEEFLAELMPKTGSSIRMGMSGAPGVGKSTFIEAIGKHLTGLNHKVAVLAVDPSSLVSGGSILGDKTRMEELARDPGAFIRPSPAGKTLGGVARRTREAMLLCEAAGFDVVIIETVGVGQSETAVADMVDIFVLLQLPGGGDDLQGIKRGIMELADMIAINKADGALEKVAKIAQADFKSALRLLRPKSPNWRPEVLLASALNGTGISEIWDSICTFEQRMADSGELERNRARQAKAWMWKEIEDGMLDAFAGNSEVAGLVDKLEADVGAGLVTPAAAAATLLESFQGGKRA